MRFAPMLVILVAAFIKSDLAFAQSDDLQARLDQAVSKYNETVAKVTETVADNINKKIKAAMTKGDLQEKKSYEAALDQLQRGSLPESASLKVFVDRAKSELKRGKTKLLGVYKEVEQEYVKQGGKDNLAEAVLVESQKLDTGVLVDGLAKRVSRPPAPMPENKRLLADATVATNREVAMWVITQGGTVGIEKANRARVDSIKSVEQLPLEPFVVVGVDLTGNRSLDQGGYQKLAPLGDLEVLAVGASTFSDQSLECVRKMRKLKKLTVNFTTVTGRGLASLDDQPLEDLDMSSVTEPAAAVRHLHKEGRIKLLNMFGITLTDEMIRLLGETKSLEVIWFSRDRVSEQQVNNLKKSLPSVSIQLL